MPSFIVAFVAAFTILALARFRWALLVLISLLPAYLIRFSVGPIPSTLLEVMILIVAAAWLLNHGTSFDFARLRLAALRMIKLEWPLVLGIVLLLAAGTISVLIAPDIQAAAGLWKAYIIEPVLLFVIFVTSFSKKDTPVVVRALSITVLVTAGIAIYQKYTGAWIPNPYWAAEETRRATSVWGFPNAIGLFMAPLIPLFLAQKKNRLYYIFVSALALVAIVFAKTTGALAALGGTLFIVGMINKKTRIPVAVSGGAVALVIWFVPGLTILKQELLLQDYSGNLRTDMWAEGAELISDNPILGTGLSSYQSEIYRYRIDKWVEVFQYPHNLILNFWIELGILGIGAFTLLFYWAIKRASNYAILSALLVIIIHGLVDVPFFKNDLAVQLWLILALIFIHEKKNGTLVRGLNRNN